MPDDLDAVLERLKADSPGLRGRRVPAGLALATRHIAGDGDLISVYVRQVGNGFVVCDDATCLPEWRTDIPDALTRIHAADLTYDEPAGEICSRVLPIDAVSDAVDRLANLLKSFDTL